MTNASPNNAIGGEIAVWRSSRSILAESMWWDDDALHWCDITRGALHVGRADGPVDGSEDRVLLFEPPLASFQPRADGGFVMALGDTVLLCDGNGGDRQLLAAIEHAQAGTRLNEGKCDPSGAFQVGSMNFASGEPDGAIYRIHPGGAIEVVLGGFGVANGFEWSADETIAYLTDTSVETIYSAPWDPMTGPGELTSWAAGRPHDGPTLDQDGCFWSGIYGSGEVVRLSSGGEVIQRLAVPTPNVTSVAFGGADGSTLFIASARENLTEDDLEKWPESGSIFAVPTTTRGYPVRTFAG